jgi:hypothetical protein
MEEEIIQKIYKLTNELAAQQQSNQDLASTLNSQLADLKVLVCDKYKKYLYSFLFIRNRQKLQQNHPVMVRKKNTETKQNLHC